MTDSGRATLHMAEKAQQGVILSVGRSTAEVEESLFGWLPAEGKLSPSAPVTRREILRVAPLRQNDRG